MNNTSSKNRLNYRALVKASEKEIETENSYILTADARKALMLGAEKIDLDFSKTHTLSVYLETFSNVDGWPVPTLGFLENGVTFRLRQEGTAHKIDKQTKNKFVCATYPGQVSLKKIDADFQKYANDISARQRPDSGFLKPRTRKELEVSFSYAALSEMHYHDLPDGHIKNIIEDLVLEGKIEGVDCLSDLTLRPIVATDVLRREAHVFIDPNDADPNDFLRTWPHSKLTPEMKKDEEWVELGLCIDKMNVREPGRDLPISEVVGASKKDLLKQAKFADLAYVPMVENEVLKCGKNTNDEMLVRAYIDFGMALRDYVRDETGFTLVPSWSKGVTAIGALEECRPNGRLHDKYVRLQKIAP